MFQFLPIWNRLFSSLVRDNFLNSQILPLRHLFGSAHRIPLQIKVKSARCAKNWAMIVIVDTAVKLLSTWLLPYLKWFADIISIVFSTRAIWVVMLPICAHCLRLYCISDGRSVYQKWVYLLGSFISSALLLVFLYIPLSLIIQLNSVNHRHLLFP